VRSRPPTEASHRHAVAIGPEKFQQAVVAWILFCLLCELSRERGRSAPLR